MIFTKIIVIPLGISILVQFIKMVPDILKGNFSLKNITNYGGMPSGHGALVASLSTMVGIEQGINTVEFGITSVIAIIVLRDSVGLRRIIGKQGKAINTLNSVNENVPALQERVGHSPLEVLIGVLIGVGLAFFINSLI